MSNAETQRRRRCKCPPTANCKSSASILVPRDDPEIEIKDEEYSSDYARSMSRRRNSADLERLGKEARQTFKE